MFSTECRGASFVRDARGCASYPLVRLTPGRLHRYFHVLGWLWMTRASDWRSPSRDLITRESFADQRTLVTTLAPRPLLFSVKVNSVLDTGSRLVSITATAVAFLFSYRSGCIAIGHQIRPLNL